MELGLTDIGDADRVEEVFTEIGRRFSLSRRNSHRTGANSNV
jgi:hypothetical protein